VEAAPKPPPRVERTWKRAEREARSRGHDYLGTEHVLLALIADPDGIAGQVLLEMGVADEAAQRVKALMEPSRNSS
jgi:ATP-dependent Clp protease ATP-binding subunit ClpC